MGEVILLLIAFMQQAQVVFGATSVIIRRPPDPIIVGMAGRAIVHNTGDYIKGFSEWLIIIPAV
jgi:hypothetical protein